MPWIGTTGTVNGAFIKPRRLWRKLSGNMASTAARQNRSVTSWRRRASAAITIVTTIAIMTATTIATKEFLISFFFASACDEQALAFLWFKKAEILTADER